MEHTGASFVNSCIKMPVDPYSRQPAATYERPSRFTKKKEKRQRNEKCRKKDLVSKSEQITDTCDSRLLVNSFMDFIDSIPDYDDVQNLSNEQFRQHLEYLKRRHWLLLTNLRNCLESSEGKEEALDTEKVDFGNQAAKVRSDSKTSERRGVQERNKKKQCCVDGMGNTLKLKGTKCNIEESRVSSPLLFSYGSFTGLMKDQDILTGYSSKENGRAGKTVYNTQIRRDDSIATSDRSWSPGSNVKSVDSVESDPEVSTETKSLPPQSPQKWHPTVPKPFSFTLRDDAEKYMSNVELQLEKSSARHPKKKCAGKKRRVRKVPLTSTVPLYNKLIAEKEERSRIVREESALNLMSQVRPFKLECDRRAWRSLSRSSPELSSKRSVSTSSRFKANPVPRNLFSNEIYDRMLEDEYYRLLQKRIRALEMMKSSSLPPSMARRQRVKSASTVELQQDVISKDSFGQKLRKHEEMLYTPMQCSERSRSAMALYATNGNNLAAFLRCQVSRERLEREIQQQLEERLREQNVKLRKALLARKPAWRALRSAARFEHEKDLEFRTKLRQNEAREQAERHRVQMEMMLDRVMQIPTLFERHSQNFQNTVRYYTKLAMECAGQKCKNNKKEGKNRSSSSMESYASLGGSSSSPRPNSRSPASSSKSSKSSESSQKSTVKSDGSFIINKKKSDRGALKVSINETAELIDDNCRHQDNNTYSTVENNDNKIIDKKNEKCDDDK